MDAKPDWIDRMSADLKSAQAEIERLRAEVDYWRGHVSSANHQRDAANARASNAHNDAIDRQAEIIALYQSAERQRAADLARYLGSNLKPVKLSETPK